MKENVGGLDRNIRFIAGGGLIAAALMSRIGMPWRIGALLLGASELITATTQYCPMNAFLQVDTNRETEPDLQSLSPETKEAKLSQPMSDASAAI
jgi:hypothetical protein